MDAETETTLLKNWVSIYEEFELSYRGVYVEILDGKKKKAHVDYAHHEPTNNHVNSAVLHEPQAKWCIILCLDAMLSTALTQNVNDQNGVFERRTFNQHEVLRMCIFQPKPKRQAPPVVNYAVEYASMALPGLYCPQPGYYLPCHVSASNLVSSDGPGSNSSSEENPPSLGFPSLVPPYHPVVPGDLPFSQPVRIFVPPPHHRYPSVSSLHPSSLNPITGSAQDHFRQASVGSSSNSALAVLKQHIVAAASTVATGAPQNPVQTATTSSSSTSSSSSSFLSDKNKDSSRSSSGTGGTRKRTLETEPPPPAAAAVAVSAAPPLPLMPTATVPDWVPAPWQPMPGHPHPFAGLPLTNFPGMPLPPPVHMGQGAAIPKVTPLVLARIFSPCS